MAFTTLLGFDGLTANTTTALTQAALTSLLVNSVSPVASVPPWSIAAMYDSSTQTIQTRNLSNGTSRNFFCSRLTSQSSYCRLNYTYANTLSAIPKTGKWYYGMRVYYSAMNAASPVVATVRLGSGAAWTINLPTGSGAGIYYLELVVDWVALTATGYINGVQVVQMTGANYVAASYASMYMYIGPAVPSTGTISGTQYLGFTDVYFIVEEANEPNPISGRLGPILVKSLPIAAVSNASRFTPPAGSTVLDTLNANNTGIGSSTTSYNMANGNTTTDPHGDIAEATFTAPVETGAIKAVQLQVITHKLQAAAAGTLLQLKQGATTLTADKTVPGLVTAPTLKAYGFSKAFDGTDWTAEKLGQLKIDVGSYRP